MLNSKNKKAQGATEYVIILVLVAICSITVIGLFGDSIRNLFVGASIRVQGGDEELPEVDLSDVKVHRSPEIGMLQIKSRKHSTGCAETCHRSITSLLKQQRDERFAVRNGDLEGRGLVGGLGGAVGCGTRVSAPNRRRAG